MPWSSDYLVHKIVTFHLWNTVWHSRKWTKVAPFFIGVCFFLDFCNIDWHYSLLLWVSSSATFSQTSSDFIARKESYRITLFLSVSFYLRVLIRSLQHLRVLRAHIIITDCIVKGYWFFSSLDSLLQQNLPQIWLTAIERAESLQGLPPK